MSEKYTEKQIEAYNILSDEGKNISSDDIETIIEMIGKEKPVNENVYQDKISELKIKLMEEKDWRKRASISAMIISKNLE
jgi:ribosomal protein L12E/L44/L45/RPP1/RPP2